jgi:hypothetical protein
MIIKKNVKLLIFGVLFLVISPIIVLYANGNRLAEGWSLLRTGGIYVTNAPIGSEVYINNKLKDKITFFQRDVLIKNLRSGVYDVQVKKDGYNTWFKKIKVNNNLVSDADVFILPEEIEIIDIPKYILENPESTSTKPTKIKNQEYLDILTLFSATNTKISKVLSTSSMDFKSNLGTKISPIMNGKEGLWKEKSQIFIKWFGKAESTPKYLCDEILNCTESKLIFQLSKEPKNINFLPGYDGVIVVANENLIFAVQIEENPHKGIQILYKGINPDFRINNNNLYVKEGDIISEISL